MNHPLRPTLYDDPVVNMAYDRWDKFHIWLHKQPLFLWQIALSFKLFGISLFTLRLPSVLLGVVLVFIGYRTGKLLVNVRTGFFTGMLIISSFYSLELVAGRLMVDHNDFSFLVYISLSIWSLVEYHYSGKKIWIYLIGLFSGFAILCKWLVGLLVYAGWFILKIKGKKSRVNDLKDILTSLIITVIIAMPWQIYTLIRFPDETRLAQAYNVQHLYKSIEGHLGGAWYHFDEFNVLYGPLASFLIIPAFIVLFKKMKDKNLFSALLGIVCITYLFFSLVQTKMPGFPIIVTLLVYIPLAALIDSGFDLISKIKRTTWIKHLLAGALVISIFLVRFDIGKIKAQHTLRNEDNSYTRMLTHNKEIFKSLRLPAKTVIFNVKGQHYIEAMFYTGLPAYRFIPTYEQYQDMKDKERVVAIFKPVSGDLPDYLKTDTSIIILDQVLQGYN
jgi:4-amino-4-deoxy-L-arabinose transferase